MRNFSAHETEWMLELDGIELAGFWSRAWAFVIDGLIVSLIFMVVVGLYMLTVVGVRIESAKLHGRPVPTLQQIVMAPPFNVKAKDDVPVVTALPGEIFKIVDEIVMPILYFGVLLWRGKGQTPGKRVMKIRVMSIVHRHLSFWHCVERALGYGAAALEAGFGFVQFFIHPYRRCAQDRLAETIVVTERGYQAMQHKWEHPLLPDTAANANAPE
jgi:uncharacterized RDD family membrane protein YckC